MDFNTLNTINDVVNLHDLQKDHIKLLQRGLNCLTYDAGSIDGIIGKKTMAAWLDFKLKTDLPANPQTISPKSVEMFIDRLGWIMPTPGRYDFSSKQSTIDSIKIGCGLFGIGIPAQTAYIIATADWETDGTFEPVREAPTKTDVWREKHLRYYPYYGRGLVQITWDYNYKKYGELLGIDLLNNPDLALDPDIALFILIHGFKTGAFTGKKIDDYITATVADFRNARRCINGTDRAQIIAEKAELYLRTLTTAKKKDKFQLLSLRHGEQLSQPDPESFATLQTSVIDWAEQRGIFMQSDMKSQCLKTLAEAGELADAVNKNDADGINDGIGDVVVTLILLAKLHGVTLEQCLNHAYDEIKNRTGQMTNGVFVKDIPT